MIAEKPCDSRRLRGVYPVYPPKSERSALVVLRVVMSGAHGIDTAQTRSLGLLGVYPVRGQTLSILGWEVGSGWLLSNGRRQCDDRAGK